MLNLSRESAFFFRIPGGQREIFGIWQRREKKEGEMKQVEFYESWDEYLLARNWGRYLTGRTIPSGHTDASDEEMDGEKCMGYEALIHMPIVDKNGITRAYIAHTERGNIAYIVRNIQYKRIFLRFYGSVSSSAYATEEAYPKDEKRRAWFTKPGER